MHPLDAQSVPYNFSSTTSPLLRKAARSLGLSARSREPYTALFGSVSSSSSASLPPLDVKYSGHILVSGYSVSYVLPKEFPPRTFENDNYGKRAGKEIHFMAAIDVWAPFVSKPPHSPYLVSEMTFSINSITDSTCSCRFPYQGACITTFVYVSFLLHLLPSRLLLRLFLLRKVRPTLGTSHRTPL